MSLHKLLTIYFPIDITDKENLKGLTGFVGQGNYSVWLDADRIILHTGEGSGNSYRFVLEAHRGPNRELQAIQIVEFDEFQDDFRGTTIEHYRTYGARDSNRFLEAMFLESALHRYIGDVQDVPLLYNGVPVNDPGIPLSQVEGSKWGSMEAVWAKGMSGQTHDGFWLQPMDWDGIPAPIRAPLERGGNVRLRYPSHLPPTLSRTGPAWRVVSKEEIEKQKRATLAFAAVEGMQQYGVWIPGVPQDVLYGEPPLGDTPEAIEADADRLNQGRWNSVDWSRYGDNNATVALLMRLKGQKSGMSLLEIREKIEKDKNLKTIIERIPGLRAGVHEAGEEIESSMQRKAIKKRRVNLEAPHFLRFTNGLLESLGEKDLKTDFFAYDGLVFAPAAAFQTSDSLIWNEQLARSWERLLMRVGKGNARSGDYRSLVGASEGNVHEFIHVEEIRDVGKSSHLTHQSETKEVRDSFASGMETHMDQLIASRWVPIVEKNSSDSGSDVQGAIGFWNKIGLRNIVTIAHLENILLGALTLGITAFLIYLGLMPQAPPANFAEAGFFLTKILSVSGILYMFLRYLLLRAHYHFGVAQPTGPPILRDWDVAREATKTASLSLISVPFIVTGMITTAWWSPFLIFTGVALGGALHAGGNALIGIPGRIPGTQYLIPIPLLINRFRTLIPELSNVSPDLAIISGTQYLIPFSSLI